MVFPQAPAPTDADLASFEALRHDYLRVSSQSPGVWADTSTDPKTKEQLAALNGFLERQAEAIREGIPSARVVKLTRANHDVFLSNEADVLREMRAFLAALR